MVDYKNTLLNKKVIDLSEISESGLEKLFNDIDIKQIAKGDNVLNLHEVCKYVFFVESGYLRTFTYKDGVEINTDFAFEGSFATNVKSLRSGSASEMIIQAVENTITYVFEKEKLFALYKDSPEIESFG